MATEEIASPPREAVRGVDGDRRSTGAADQNDTPQIEATEQVSVAVDLASRLDAAGPEGEVPPIDTFGLAHWDRATERLSLPFTVHTFPFLRDKHDTDGDGVPEFHVSVPWRKIPLRFITRTRLVRLVEGAGDRLWIRTIGSCGA